MAVALVLLLQGCFWYLERDPNEVQRGAAAPAFALTSQQDETVTLDALREQGHVVLVFYRGLW